MNLQPPEYFQPWTNPQDVSTRWIQWAKKFTSYVLASGITDETRKRQLLLYCSGEEVTDISEQITETGTTLANLVEALGKYFAGRDNVVFIRYSFRQCVQKVDEPVDAWYAKLHKLSEACQFGDIRSSLERDQIVAGCTSDAVRRILL